MTHQLDDIKATLQKLKGTLSIEQSKSLKLDKCEKIVKKLETFSGSCAECHKQLNDFTIHVKKLEENVDKISETEKASHKQWLNTIISHLQTKHNVVSEGYYFSIFMSIGISLGVAFGLTVFDNIGLGISFGMSIGIAIGVGMDSDAKKKGRTI